MNEILKRHWVKIGALLAACGVVAMVATLIIFIDDGHRPYKKEHWSAEQCVTESWTVGHELRTIETIIKNAMAGNDIKTITNLRARAHAARGSLWTIAARCSQSDPLISNLAADAASKMQSLINTMNELP